ncbi:hypothetical protein CIK05_01325 [Bdellovibrio sp. qaytius]|nr:hypothetical protein CIK05_01325 [Bdellovibrio sp. qaytius]
MIEQDILISGKKKDLGGFTVSRTLPNVKRRHVGPFVFLDHMGPLQVDHEHLMSVRPHPHIGLSTVTYLFSGRGLHRDSLGSKQIISPGDLNWMTAGRGIVHSERTPTEDISAHPKKTMHGIQIWVALPVEQEECAPNFTHYPQDILPKFNLSEELSGKLLIGSHQNITSPVKTYSQTFFADITVDKSVNNVVSISEEEIGVFLLEGEATINDQVLTTDDLMLVAKPSEIKIEASKGTRLIFIGGTEFKEPRYIWWNFVSSRRERIREAAEQWKNQLFGTVAEENDFIPLPNDPMP